MKQRYEALSGGLDERKRRLMVAPEAGQIACPSGRYSLIGLPGGLKVPSDSFRYGWSDRNAGSYDNFDPSATATDSGHGYWAWFACSRPLPVGVGTTKAQLPLGAYHASMVGNPSGSSAATASGQDFAATWVPEMNGGTGGYRISGYQAAETMPVGYGTWVFSYRDTTVDIRTQN